MAFLARREWNMKTAVIYGAAMPEAGKAGKWLGAHGWKVITIEKEELTAQRAEEIGAIDMLVISVDPSWDGEDAPVGGGRDYDAMADRISAGIYEVPFAVETLFPCLEAGEGKRIAFLTGKYGSIRHCRDRDHFAPHMILAGIHMLAKMMYNRLRRDGYTMRMFAADGDEKEVGQMICAGEYFAMDFCYDEKEPYIHSDENRLVMRDGWFDEIAW